MCTRMLRWVRSLSQASIAEEGAPGFPLSHSTEAGEAEKPEDEIACALFDDCAYGHFASSSSQQRLHHLQALKLRQKHHRYLQA